MASKYKRGKIWWARTQSGGREYRASLGTSDSTVADRRMAKWVKEVVGLKYGERPSLFEVAVTRFHSEHFPNLKENSQRRYKVSLANLAVMFGGKHLSGIRRADLSEFETMRRAAGASDGTIRRDLACLSSLMTSALDWEVIEANPVPTYLHGRSRRGLKEAPGRTRYLSPAEEARLLSAAAPGLARAISFAIDTGLRREEQFSLTWDRIDLATRTIRLEAGSTKGNRERLVPLLPRAVNVLEQMPRHFMTAFVFRHNDSGERFVEMTRALYRAAERAGIPDLCWHDLRRTCGCRLLQVYKRSMTEVRDILGHASVVTTEKSYAFLNQESTIADLTKEGRA